MEKFDKQAIDEKVRHAMPFEHRWHNRFHLEMPFGLINDKEHHVHLFLDAALKDDSSSIIYESVIKMSQKLGFETVAEGVETKEQFNYLRERNIDIVQGFLLGKPVSKVEFEKILIRQIP